MQYKKIYLSILLLLFLPFQAEAKKVKVIDYKLSKFTEIADEPFFYSIGNTLRYAKTISKKNPILFKGDFFGGELKAVYPSPDNKKAIVYTKNKLYLITLTEPPKLILNSVDIHEASSVDIGSYFFSIHSLRWNETSKYIYIVKYKKRKGIWKTLTGMDTKLLRININNPTQIELVIMNFSSRNYYFVGTDTVCFNYAPGNGNLMWKCMYQNKRIEVKSQTKDRVILKNDIVLDGKPFVNSRIIPGGIRLTDNGFFLKEIRKGISGFFSKAYGENPIFKIKTSHDFKGYFIDGIRTNYSNVLPGGRYALVNMNTKNLKGQLLVDGLTGKYKELPSKTKVYINLNSFNHKNFHFKSDEINNPEFIPANKFRRMLKDL